VPIELAWQLLRRSVNSWRRERLSLPPLPITGGFKRMNHQHLPVMCAYSKHVLPPPTGWPEWHHIAGYWFLDESPDWEPPAEVARFLADGPPPVFVGFGSMEDQQPERMTATVVKALEASGQRGIIQSGWMGLGSMHLPESILQVDSLPHSWLFPKMAAVVHHGGSGTTAAGLRAGVPSIITPVLGDQLFWAQRIEQLGVGFSPATFHKLTAEPLAAAIDRAVHDSGVRECAAAMGTRIRDENGVAHTVRLIEELVS